MGTRDFASPEVKAESDAQLTDIVTKGKAPKMPAYGDKLKDTRNQGPGHLHSHAWPSKSN